MTLPRGATMLLNKAADPWTYRVRHVTTEAAFTGLSEDEDGDGHRHRIEVTETVDSIGVRFDHPDGRAAVAVWVRRAGTKSYKFTVGVRGRHEAEYTPVELNARDLGAYLAACGAGEGT